MGRKRKYFREGDPPLCACGCRQPVSWREGKGWSTYIRGHSRRGRKSTEEHKHKISEAAKQRYAGKRRRDTEDEPGTGVYASWEYREARKAIEGQPCSKCGSADGVCTHHETPGDDSTLVPLCRHCHPTAHAAPGAKGQQPPPGEEPPLCACGCGQPVAWKRVRGWAKFRKGHSGAKVPADTRLQDAPLCKCGCGDPTKFRFGRGWNEYKRGHRQRVEGGYRSRG